MNKQGRPLRGDARKPAVMVGVRMTRHERARFEARARSSGITLSAWIRRASEAFADLTEISLNETLDASNETP